MGKGSPRTKNMTDQVFGKLTALSVSKVDSGGNSHWWCQCECGSKISVVGTSLRRGLVICCDKCKPMDYRINDLKDRVFGEWRVLALDRENKRAGSYWLCVCSCGVFRSILSQNLTQGRTLSCRHTPWHKHRMADTRIYSVWAAMKARCSNQDHPNFKDYGGRGITIQDSWYNFEGFYEDMKGTYEEGLELDRIDNDSGYSKDNCRWTTRSVNCFNTRKRKDNTSGRTGVYKLKDGTYEVKITCKQDTIRLGGFETFEEACKAREDLELKYFGKAKE